MKKFISIGLIYSLSCFAWMKESPIITGAVSNGKWSTITQNSETNILTLLEMIEKSSSGKLLVMAAKDKASEQGGELLDFIKEGRGSLTDTTLTRRFSAHNPEDVRFETKSIVYLNKELSVMNAVLDLTHELTHFVFREAFNPYKSNFTLDQFIKSTIEGRGGEVQAFMMECRVLKELYPSSLQKRNNCYKIFDEGTGTFSQNLAVSRFYQVGSFYQNFRKKLREKGISEKFDHITDKEASFISSAYGVPYPVAAYSEYVSVVTKVCENDRKRLALMSMKKGRTPASETEFQRKLASHQNKCDELI